jgi:iron complex outermembrane receptor protein
MGWGTGFRAPSLRQMNPQQVFSLAALPTLAPDSCDYSAGYTGRVDTIRCSGSEVYTEGNADLKPERSQSVSLGVRHEPNAQWSWGADYWSLHVKDIFGSFNFNDILADPNLYAQYATLPALGSPERIRLVAQNLGRLDRRGIDYDLHYRRNTDWGRFRASLRGTHYLGSRRAFAPGEPSVNELANYVYQTERYVPRNKFRLQLQLDKPQWNWTAVVDVISGNSERVNGITAAGTPATISRKVPMYWTMGLMAKLTPSRGVELYAGIDNVFDRLPPARYASPASQGFVPGLDTRYGTYWGRTFKLGLNLKF